MSNTASITGASNSSFTCFCQPRAVLIPLPLLLFSPDCELSVHTGVAGAAPGTGADACDACDTCDAGRAAQQRRKAAGSADVPGVISGPRS